MGVYDFSEGNGMVQVCVLLLPPSPSGGLECSIVATLALMDGLKAGTLRDYSYHYVLTTIDTTLFPPSFISQSLLQYEMKTTLLQIPWRSPSQ